MQAVAQYAFAAEAEGELSISPGDQLVVEAEVDGWYQVRLGVAGLLPGQGGSVFDRTALPAHGWYSSDFVHTLSRRFHLSTLLLLLLQVVRDGDGARGLVPASYVEVEGQPAA